MGDLIFILFEAHKLDLSDEFKDVILALHQAGNGDKIRCVLNKADQLEAGDFVRVYGALMWNLGKILGTPEVARVYCGSFWENPYIHDDHEQVFEQDRKDLMAELRDLPRNAAVRKINEMVARIRLVKVHICMMAALKASMPLFGSWLPAEQQQKLLSKDLNSVFERALADNSSLSPGDMPDLEEFRKKILNIGDFGAFQRLNKALDPNKQLRELDKVLELEMPRLMEAIGCVTDSEFRMPKPRPALASWDGRELKPKKRRFSGLRRLIRLLIGLLLLWVLGKRLFGVWYARRLRLKAG